MLAVVNCHSQSCNISPRCILTANFDIYKSKFVYKKTQLSLGIGISIGNCFRANRYLKGLLYETIFFAKPTLSLPWRTGTCKQSFQKSLKAKKWMKMRNKRTEEERNPTEAQKQQQKRRLRKKLIQRKSQDIWERKFSMTYPLWRRRSTRCIIWKKIQKY